MVPERPGRRGTMSGNEEFRKEKDKKDGSYEKG